MKIFFFFVLSHSAELIGNKKVKCLKTYTPVRFKALDIKAIDFE